ncbi:MAG: hypothetical protein ACR2HE_08925 [Casimicrobiaceae bacterium]
MERYGHCFILSATIAQVIARGAFVPTLVVTGETSHELLTVRVLTCLNLSKEGSRVHTPQSGCELPTVHDLDSSILARAVGEAKIARGWRSGRRTH